MRYALGRLFGLIPVDEINGSFITYVRSKERKSFQVILYSSDLSIGGSYFDDSVVS